MKWRSNVCVDLLLLAFLCLMLLLFSYSDKMCPICYVVRSAVVMETHPIIIVIIRALYSHLSCYHDNGDATTAVIRRHLHVVAICTPQPDRMNTGVTLGPKFGCLTPTGFLFCRFCTFIVKKSAATISHRWWILHGYGKKWQLSAFTGNWKTFRIYCKLTFTYKSTLYLTTDLSMCTHKINRSILTNILSLPSPIL